MFTVGTILERKEHKDDEYDVVKIVGISTLKRPEAEEWAASGNQGIIVESYDSFGPVQTLSFQELSNNYFIREESDGMPIVPASSNGTQESPEAVFAREAAKAQAKEQTQPTQESKQKTSPSSTDGPKNTGAGRSKAAKAS